MPSLQKDPPVTNFAFANHLEKMSSDNGVEKLATGLDVDLDYPQPQQQRASLEAERAVVRKLDWRVCFLLYLLLLSIFIF